MKRIAADRAALLFFALDTFFFELRWLPLEAYPAFFFLVFVADIEAKDSLDVFDEFFRSSPP